MISGKLESETAKQPWLRPSMPEWPFALTRAGSEVESGSAMIPRESWVARIYCAPTAEEAWVDFSKALAVCRSRLTMPFLN